MTQSFRHLTVSAIVVALAVAACSSDDATSTTATVAALSSSVASPTSSVTSSTAADTTTTVPAPSSLTLETVVQNDPVDGLTIEHLESIEIQESDAIFTAVFPETDEEITVEIVDAGGTTVSCGPNVDGDQQCSIFGSDGSYTFEVFGPSSIPNAVAFPATVTADSIDVTVDGTAYEGVVVRFQVGPVFVQINPNTGGLSEPVTRTVGEASAAEIAAALG